jgi:pyridoxamine-phosphate oxidase
MSLAGDPERAGDALADPASHPMVMLARWMDAAGTLGVREPESICLSTVDANGVADARMVSLKTVDAAGVVFGTSSLSPKGLQLRANPSACAVLYWKETLQQVRIRGDVSLLDDAASDVLFAARDRWARAVSRESQQSQPMVDVDALRGRVRAAAESDDPLTRPPAWFAYRLSPRVVEFWHGRHDRFHARLRYHESPSGWETQLLQP